MASFSLRRVIPQSVLEQSPEPCFVLDDSLAIVYCNASWDRFALANGAGPEVLRERVISKNLLDFIVGELNSYYSDLFARVRAGGMPVSHDYECSSAGSFRLYRMQIFPVESGFAVVNSLRLEHAHTRQALAPDETIYRNTHGLVHMCANCRRTNRVTDPARWDWVPAYRAGRRAEVTHGVCPPCREFFYRSYLQSQRPHNQ